METYFVAMCAAVFNFLLHIEETTVGCLPNAVSGGHHTCRQLTE